MPGEIAVTCPFSTVATSVFEEDHVKVLSVVVSGSIVAVIMNVSPSVRVFSVTSSEIPAASIIFALTVTEQEASRPFEVDAVITAVPGAMAVTFPFSTVATSVFEEDHVTVLSVVVSGSIVAVMMNVSPSIIVFSVTSSVMPCASIIFAVTVTEHDA